MSMSIPPSNNNSLANRVPEELKVEESKNSSLMDQHSILSLPQRKRNFTSKSLPQTRTIKFGEIENPSALKRKKIKSNQVTTAKYTLITFLPLALFVQITKLSNIYFLFFAILQIVPAITNTGGQPTMLVPLVTVVLVSIIKDFVEDYKRQVSDREENGRGIFVANREEMGFEKKKWKNLKVGQIVKVCQDEMLPADLVLINSSSKKGVAYVETKNLDGETNLKHKMANQDIIQFFQNEEDIILSKGTLSSEEPNSLLYSFEATITVGGEIVPLSAEQLLLRGSTLRNTQCIYGIVVFTGHQSKIMMNSIKAKQKFSKVEYQTYLQIILVLALQIIFCLVCSGVGTAWIEHMQSGSRYLELSYDSKKVIIFLTMFGSWLLVFVQMVPISLLVSLEVVRFFQGVFIGWDPDIFDINTNNAACAQSSGLNEELGDVNYIFSDKTGTLTCNIMEFKKFSVGKTEYGDSQQDVCRIPFVKFNDSLIFNHLEGNEISKHKHQMLLSFLTNMAICHSIIVEEKPEGIKYNSSSPDELALLYAAKFLGFFYLGNDDKLIKIKYKNRILEYQLLNILEFTSSRKRMSVIVRIPSGEIKLICKGADSVIFERLHPQSKYKEETQTFLDKFSNEGLRTLAFAEKIIPPHEYQKWNESYKNASLAIQNREQKLANAAEQIEKNLYLAGSTAIEDRLQDEVGEVIEFIKSANIHFWVLTGDKVETAVNIAYSCKLLNSQMEKININGKTSNDVYHQLTQKEQEVTSLLQMFPQKKTALIITGDSLVKCSKHDEIKDLLLSLITNVSVVIACRVSPKQKAEIVKLVRDNQKDAITLAIGDGANDVNMIAAAHVGIGIRGLEGQQAARCSDYSISQFKYLKNLMFVHGRECLRRNSYVICYSFYKNLLIVLPIFWHGFYSAFSGITFYNQWIYQLFNTIYTSVPVILFAIFDKQYEKETLLSDSKYYIHGMTRKYFNSKVFWSWMVYAIFQSCLIFYYCIYVFCSSTNSSGKMEDMLFTGMFAFTIILVFVNLKLFVDSYTHTILSIVFIILSILSYVGNYILLSYLSSTNIFSTYWRYFNLTNIGMAFFLLFGLLILDKMIFQVLFPSLRFFYNFILPKKQKNTNITFSQIAQNFRPKLRSSSKRKSKSQKAIVEFLSDDED